VQAEDENSSGVSGAGDGADELAKKDATPAKTAPKRRVTTKPASAKVRTTALHSHVPAERVPAALLSHPCARVETKEGGKVLEGCEVGWRGRRADAPATRQEGRAAQEDHHLGAWCSKLPVTSANFCFAIYRIVILRFR
jgi:hypothetical protein